MSDYGVFAAYYDRLTQNVNYKERADYFRTLLSDFGVKEGSLLDLACGTGSLLYEFASMGFDTIGVDSSADMLTMARSKAGFFEHNPLLLCQKMQDLDLYGTIDCAVCALDSINHLTDQKDVRKTFERVHLFLNPDGLFIFDVNTEYKHEHTLGDNAYIYDLGDLFCAWQNSYDDASKTVEMSLDFFVNKGGNNYLRETQFVREKAYPLEKLKKMLNEVGFTLLAVYDDLSFDEVRETTQRAVFVARK
ncbi:MAG TPA: methyltransferase domain-containing protein [Clostridiales bacterium]|nr:methyltransferase domain-containing protein [Clostridiales bacterium]